MKNCSLPLNCPSRNSTWRCKISSAFAFNTGLVRFCLFPKWAWSLWERIESCKQEIEETCGEWFETWREDWVTWTAARHLNLLPRCYPPKTNVACFTVPLYVTPSEKLMIRLPQIQSSCFESFFKCSFVVMEWQFLSGWGCELCVLQLHSTFFFSFVLDINSNRSYDLWFVCHSGKTTIFCGSESNMISYLFGSSGSCMQSWFWNQQPKIPKTKPCGMCMQYNVQKWWNMGF